MSDNLNKIKEQYGFRSLGEFKRIRDGWDVLETGILPLDMALGDSDGKGRLGIRARSIFEIAGFPNSSKSSSLVQMIKTTVDRYGKDSVVGLFAEPPDFNTFQDKGVNLDDIIVQCCYNPDLSVRHNMAEEWLNGMLKMVQDPSIKLAFIDSVSALVVGNMVFEGSGTKEKGVEDKFVASLANVFNNFLARFLYQADSAVLCLISHYKEQLWADPFAKMRRSSLGSEDQYNTKGGTGIHFYSQKRCMLKSFKQSEDKDYRHSVENTKSPDLIKVNFDMYKRKDGAPRSTIGYLSMKDGSYNNEECLLDYAAFFGTRKKVKEGNTDKTVTISDLEPKVASAGAWFYIGDEKFNGKDNAIEYLKANPSMYESLKKQVFARHNEYFADKQHISEALDG